MGSEACEENVMLLLKKLSLGIEAAVNKQTAVTELTGSQCRLLGYLIEHREERLCSTDIHIGLKLSRATVSEILKKLRQKGFICFEASSEDDRCKYIALTDQAYELDEFMNQVFYGIEQQLYQNFTGKEREEFELLIKKMLGNL